MKKILAVILITILSFACLTGCSKSVEDEEVSAVTEFAQYEITDGLYWSASGSSDTLTFEVKADFSKFLFVMLDQFVADSNGYSVDRENGTVTFNRNYLEMVEYGPHTVTVVFSDGTASTTFYIPQPQQ